MHKQSCILVIDSSTSVLRIGLALPDGRVDSLCNKDRYRHAEYIFKLIESLFERNGLDKSALEAVIVSIGPGSFTGLRVGLSSAKGIAASLTIPLIGISTFSALAKRVFNKYKRAALLIPSRKDEFYLGIIESEIFCDDNISMVRMADIPQLTNNLPILAVDYDAFKFNGIESINPSRIEPEINDFICLVVPEIEKENLNNLFSLEPLYIQKFPARINNGQR